MYIRNVTRGNLEQALASANAHFADNVCWNRLELKGQTWIVTLYVKDSKCPGARYGRTGRRMVSACWHVHGHFLDALPPDATIYTLGRLKHPGDPWQDWNAGSILYPMPVSQLCHCGGCYDPRNPSPMAQSAPQPHSAVSRHTCRRQPNHELRARRPTRGRRLYPCAPAHYPRTQV